jgi:alpha-methylacyl-CoA racemase
VLRIDRPASTSGDLLTSHKASIALDLKSPSSLATFLALIAGADVLIDPFRPGVLEKLGLDPESVLLKKNPRLIVVRLTGFRRDGKYKNMAGHDINYLAVSGVLNMLGKKGEPPFHPGNVLADFAGGGHAAFTGVLLALIHRATSGKGQVVEANMVDGVSYLGTFPRLLTKMPMWNAERGTNTLDGGAPYYGCYECKDQGRYMSVGALEPQFWAELLKGLGFTEAETTPGKLDRLDKRSWPYMRELFTRRFKAKTRAEWEAIFDGTDACCAPVLSHAEMEAAGYDQRPIVGLKSSPARKIEEPWDGKGLAAGEGGEERLREWMGWKKGVDYEISAKGAFEKKDRSRL